MMGFGSGWMFFPFFFTMGIFGILGLIFWIWLLIDCIKRSFKTDTEKIVWVLIFLFLGILGALIYLFVIKLKDLNKPQKKKRRKL